MTQLQVNLLRGDSSSQMTCSYEVETNAGMTVLDVLVKIQRDQQNDLAFRRGCSIGECGTCGVQVNGVSKLACLTRLDEFQGPEVDVQPLKAFPVIRDLVVDVSTCYQQNKSIPEIETDAKKDFELSESQLSKMLEFRTCIECFLCDNEAQLKDEGSSPRYFVRIGGGKRVSQESFELGQKKMLEVAENKQPMMKDCVEKYCPQNISIADNPFVPFEGEGLLTKIMKRFGKAK